MIPLWAGEEAQRVSVKILTELGITSVRVSKMTSSLVKNSQLFKLLLTVLSYFYKHAIHATYKCSLCTLGVEGESVISACQINQPSRWDV